MKPLEPGCLALVVATFRSPHLIGSVVEVIEWVPAGTLYTSLSGVSRLRRSDFGAWHAAPAEGDSGTFHPSHLMRIDGGEDEGVTESSEEELMA